MDEKILKESFVLKGQKGLKNPPFFDDVISERRLDYIGNTKIGTWEVILTHNVRWLSLTLLSTLRLVSLFVSVNLCEQLFSALIDFDAISFKFLLLLSWIKVKLFAIGFIIGGFGIANDISHLRLKWSEPKKRNYYNVNDKFSHLYHIPSRKIGQQETDTSARCSRFPFVFSIVQASVVLGNALQIVKLRTFPRLTPLRRFTCSLFRKSFLLRNCLAGFFAQTFENEEKEQNPLKTRSNEFSGSSIYLRCPPLTTSPSGFSSGLSECWRRRGRKTFE